MPRIRKQRGAGSQAEEITSLDDWERLAPPKSRGQWVDGRSAKETAVAWLEGGGEELPAEVSALFAAHGDFGPVLDWQAEPEARLRLDEFAGEPRNSDLVVKARDRHGSYLIAVEAKADESFGDTLIGTVESAIERYVENNRSMGVTRALQLASALFGPKRQGDQKLRGIRYQLMTACAGALCEAERLGFSRAVMLVHEFVTDRTVDEKHWKNAADLNNFVKRLSHGEVGELRSGEMCGPFVVPGKPLVSRPISLYLGKVTRNIRRVHDVYAECEA